MTTKLDYLKLCVRNRKPLESKNWYIMCLSIPLPTSDIGVENKHHLELVKQSDGLYYVNIQDTQKELVKIVDSKTDEPLFTPQDVVTIDSTWLSTAKESVSVSVGNLFINAAVIEPTVGKHIGYIVGSITVKKLESLIAVKMKDDGPDFDSEKHISVSQYLDCMDRLWFFSKLANLVTIAASEKTVTQAPGTQALSKQLLQDNKDKLSDPVAVASMLDKLAEHDAQYLAGDPVASRMFDKKARTSRKKLYLMYGETNDFVTSLDSSPITSTMSQGVDTSDESLPKYMNDLRYASYSRGHSTQLSGYSYKILQRSLSGIEISDTECSTTKGVIQRCVKPSDLVGRYVRLSSKWSLIETDEQAKTYKDKIVEIRSPMYCKSPGFTICYKCMGESYKGSKNAMNNLAADFSGTLMGMFLKRMHTSGFTLTTIDSKDLIT